MDYDQPIRESAIRGHLRFWWRATRGAACKNANELSKRKEKPEIFGHTEQASQIQVVTHYETTEVKRNSKVFFKKKNHPFPRYVLSNMKDETPYLMKAQFSLNIRLSKKTSI